EHPEQRIYRRRVRAFDPARARQDYAAAARRMRRRSARRCRPLARRHRRLFCAGDAPGFGALSM
ncbi:MAG: hypothetical protein AVDCRST_MAG39-1137, partial [uncultured Sphingomonadaceae bacterium]